jgi:hypothetical protein
MGSIIRINKVIRRFYVEGQQTGKGKHRAEVQICNIKQLLYFLAIIGQKILIDQGYNGRIIFYLPL